jgi:hypothetical protein
MKNLLILLAFVLCVPSFAVTDAALEWQTDTVILATTAGFDTLTKATDSSTILSRTSEFKRYIKANNGGWTYYLQVGRLGGTSKDTAILQVAVDGYTANGVLIGRVYSDTCTDRSETYMYRLPIGAGDAPWGEAFIADQYALKFLTAHAGSAETNQLFINGPIVIRKSRPLNYSTNVTR